MERNILLTIQYDGSRFHGWQRQPSAITVQGHLEQTFSRLFQRQVSLSGTSRTDAGVHALGQRASFHTDVNIPIDRMARVMNNALCGREEGSFALSPVRILEAREMPEDFHARFDACGKKYIYRICTSREPDIFRRNYVYHVMQGRAGAPAAELDVEAMQAAAQRLAGTHDFASFESAGGNPRETTVRTIFEAKVLRAGTSETRGAAPDTAEASETRDAAPDTAEAADFARRLGARGDEILLEISGDGFLYNMVRIITGTLVEVGQGRRAPEELTEIIDAKDRRRAGHTAPPYGLYLAEVYYG